MKKIEKWLTGFCAACALVCTASFFASCSNTNDDSSSGTPGTTPTDKPYSTVTVEDVTAGTLAGTSGNYSVYTASWMGDESGHAVWTITFTSATGGTFIDENNASGTFTCDGTEITLTSSSFSGPKKHFVFKYGDVYYCALGKLTKSNSTSGIAGDWYIDWDTPKEKPFTFGADGTVSKWEGYSGTGTWAKDADKEGVIKVNFSSTNKTITNEPWLCTTGTLYSSPLKLTKTN